MSKYIPEINHLFYVRVQPRQRIIDLDNGFGMPTQQIIMEQDGSYSDWVFRCVGRDDTMLVCKPVYGGWNDDAKIFRRDGYVFEPVGPEVARALGLTSDSTTD